MTSSHSLTRSRTEGSSLGEKSRWKEGAKQRNQIAYLESSRNILGTVGNLSRPGDGSVNMYEEEL